MNGIIGLIAKMFGAAAAGFIVLFFVFLLIILGPWLLFWSIETIAAAAGFTLFIPLTFWTWLAAVVLLVLVRGGSSK